jgi:hypothetical protein
MSDRTASPEHPADQRGNEAGAADDAREAALMRAVMRAQEKHREGGVDPELDDDDDNTAAGAEPDG